ncbi:ABC transporter permease [Halostagnicola sp. A-GB9-2]|uniref:ABC transporter permease n=1 Tax=Halostagnicola sp. A-GB9-2 TaxID=3048066 RepID=UPI0024BF941A|nr:ABC transporter permease [Halostagnicola sp. A-GB9-2]MDJ1434279.1 ABC transporter permease [Halostagnicola sp. A-GB9-2]
MKTRNTFYDVVDKRFLLGLYRRINSVVKDVMRTRKGRFGLVTIVLVTAIAILAPVLAPYDPASQNLTARLTSPNTTYLLGTDSYGRDILSRIIYGFRISLLIGVVSVGVGVAIGTIMGTVSGYYGGWVDEIIGRLIDIMLAFPFLLLALIIVAVLGPSITNMMIAVGISAAPQFARLARGDALTASEKEFVTAADSIGRSHFSIIVEHIIPNIFTSVVVMATLYMGRAIIISAALSFLGLGVQPPTPSLGLILADGRDFIALAPWITIAPGLAIVLVVLGFNLLGDALNDALDPELQTGDKLQ